MDQLSLNTISEYERYNHLRPKVMQFTDETDLNNNNEQ